jgi:hypothetical protein
VQKRNTLSTSEIYICALMFTSKRPESAIHDDLGSHSNISDLK